MQDISTPSSMDSIQNHMDPHPPWKKQKKEENSNVYVLIHEKEVPPSMMFNIEEDLKEVDSATPLTLENSEKEEIMEEIDIPEEYNCEEEDDEGYPFRNLDQFCFFDTKNNLCTLERVNSIRVKGRGFVTHPNSEVKKKILIHFEVKEWNIEYGDEPAMWIRSKYAFYKLHQPENDYQDLFSSSLQKFIICSTLNFLLEKDPDIPFKEAISKMLQSFSRSENPDIHSLKERNIIFIRDFIISQLREVDKSLLNSRFVLELKKKHKQVPVQQTKKDDKKEIDKKRKLEEIKKKKEEQKRKEEEQRKKEEEQKRLEQEKMKKRFPIEDTDLPKVLPDRVYELPKIISPVLKPSHLPKLFMLWEFLTTFKKYLQIRTKISLIELHNALKNQNEVPKTVFEIHQALLFVLFQEESYKEIPEIKKLSIFPIEEYTWQEVLRQVGSSCDQNNLFKVSILRSRKSR